MKCLFETGIIKYAFSKVLKNVRIKTIITDLKVKEGKHGGIFQWKYNKEKVH